MNAPELSAAALGAALKDSRLEAKGLQKRYGARLVVKDVHLAVHAGEVVGLLGPNGAGKTTTFYMITGLVQPDEGRVIMDGHDVTTLPMYRRARLGLGYLPQEASIFRGLSVEDNILAALEVVEPVRDRREQMLDALLAEFGIAHLRRAPALALSGGERRRCEIARALATHPSYILLDEPLAGIRAHEAHDHVEGGRLAGTVRPQQPDHLPRVHREVDVLHHQPRAVALLQPLGLQPAVLQCRAERRGIELRRVHLPLPERGADPAAGGGVRIARTRPPASPDAAPATLKTSVVLL